MNFFKPKFWDKNGISFFSILLFPITLTIKLLSFIKNLFTKRHQFSIPVICVGNIYLGGTGKTPLCLELFSILNSLNRKPVFIRKKYKMYQDEINLLNKIGPVYQNKKRVEALGTAIEKKFDVAILDDGFQDFSIKKNFSIICFNEKHWIGNGFLIPSGPLREGLSALKRANCVVINGNQNTKIESKILKINKLIKIFYCKYLPMKIDKFKNKKILCFAGIGNPKNFFDLLKNNKVNVVEEVNFPDHHNFSEVELNNLIKKAASINAVLLTTEKDYLRINKNFRKDIHYLEINVEIENKNEFIEEIKKYI